MTDDTGYIIERLTRELTTLPTQKNRCIQHLTELGYIPVIRVNTLIPKEVALAKAAFLKDVKRSGLYPEITPGQLIPDDDDLLADMLGQAVDIDEGFIFGRLPEKGELNLITRIIHYRLDLFGMWEFPVSNPFNAVTLAGLKEIAGYADCSPLEAVNLMGDVEKFTQKLLKANKEEKFILTFKPANTVDEPLIRKLDRRHKFKRQLIEDFGERNDFFKYLNREVLKNDPSKIDMVFLHKEALNPFKRFILRLIQIHQWQEGLYDGLLDSDIGEVTLSSIINAVHLYNVTDRKNIQLYRVLTYVYDGYFLFNALFFLQEYMTEDQQTEYAADAEGKILSDITKAMKNAGPQSLNAFHLNLEILKDEITIASTQKPEEKKGFLKRVYFGIKRFFRKVVRFSKKIFHWIVQLSRSFMGILKKIFGHFFNNLAKGIKAFIDGIKFLFGKKSTVTVKEDKVISSVIRIDGDSTSFVSQNATELMHEHLQKIRYHTTSMIFSLSIVGGVLNIVMKAISVISWPMILFSIIRIYRNISESYKRIEFITT